MRFVALIEGGSLSLTQGAQLDALGVEDRYVLSLTRSRAAAHRASLRPSTGRLVLDRLDMAPAAVISHSETASERSQPWSQLQWTGHPLLLWAARATCVTS